MLAWRVFSARGLIVVCLLSSQARATEAPKPGCALAKACGLGVVIPGCTDVLSLPVKGVAYDAQRCSEPRDLLAHGITPAHGIGASVYPFLGEKYRVVFDVTGEAPISEARFDYLAQNLPLAARLATRFSKTRYRIQYVDVAKRRFHAARDEKLTGQAEPLFVDIQKKQRTYFGWGASKLGPWKLQGSAYVDVRIRPSPRNAKSIAYDVRVRTAPVNAMVNAIMNLGLFKGYVTGQIEDTMKDLVGAAAALSLESLEKILKDSTFTPEEHEKIRALAALQD